MGGFEDQEDQSLSSLKRKRKNDRRNSGDRIPLNKRTRKDDKRRFLVDSSDEEDNNHDTTAENTDLEENIENIAKLVRKSSTLKNKVDTPKTKSKLVPDPPKSKVPEKSAST